ncbi:4-hydroxythreonine-4-phosphate dehydrogenase PdxA [Clostridiisalibacter paucivorans]|uniref:4-hydroxythreonine-4-phosphate dehydrogenase PdxA n=1 Tax=Clostridiisalibacter paucivorans TaxID=408753 RepID=UPI00047CAFFE|nr:4-hydroxythreonine-4-phosphate dehydrogenase PdxA [Clostridiisalibacter paucivorans]
MKRNVPLIGVTMGDPAGIGPEIILKSFKNTIRQQNYNILVIGNMDVMKKVKDIIGIEDIILNEVHDTDECDFSDNILNVLNIDNIKIDELLPGEIQKMAGNAAYEYVERAVKLTLDDEIDAISTAPLNKEAMHLAGHNYPGHTEILARLSNGKDYAMFLYDESLKVIHVSTHVSLLEAIQGLSKDRIESVIKLADSTMKRLGYEDPKIAVAGINPHAGEGGLFGDEEISTINPAIEECKSLGINVQGSISPDTVFVRAKDKEFDIVVVMYHDQGHIPLKLLGFHSGVNVTVGLPIIRTSVDHGTAFNVAWKGLADESSMTQSIQLAARLIGK